MNAPPFNSSVRVITVTVSDTRTADDDASGKVLDELMGGAGFRVVRHMYIKNEIAYLQELVSTIAHDNEAEAVIFTGGTGISPRDVTVEALNGVLDKRLDGFGEAFRRMSFEQIGPRAILSRAVAGVVNACLIFSLPGSPGAVRLGVDALIVPILTHAVDLANGRTAHESSPQLPVR
jgi:molybdenum cofactor biosynthesis protein B